MNNQNFNLDAIASDSAFSVQVDARSLTLAQQMTICSRARKLYNELAEKRDLLEVLYGPDTKTLFDNFLDIIEHAEADLVFCRVKGTPAADYFEKMSRFCGQVERILRLTRFYNAM